MNRLARELADAIAEYSIVEDERELAELLLPALLAKLSRVMPMRTIRARVDEGREDFSYVPPMRSSSAEADVDIRATSPFDPTNPYNVSLCREPR